MILTVENLSKSYLTQSVFEQVSFCLEKGEIVAILGPSGVGKTTLFNCIAGLEAPDEGSVLLEDQLVTGQPGHVSYMHQKDLLLPFKTIGDNINLPLYLKGISSKEADDISAPYYASFGLEGIKDKYPYQLSGGMRQRAAFLRTFLYSQKLMLLDEPFSALDDVTRRQMQGWYFEVSSQYHLSSLLITHDIDEAILMSNRIFLMQGSPARLVKEIQIKAPSPRDLDFSLTEKAMNYKKEILTVLYQKPA